MNEVVRDSKPKSAHQPFDTVKAALFIYQCGICICSLEALTTLPFRQVRQPRASPDTLSLVFRGIGPPFFTPTGRFPDILQSLQILSRFLRYTDNIVLATYLELFRPNHSMLSNVEAPSGVAAAIAFRSGCPTSKVQAIINGASRQWPLFTDNHVVAEIMGLGLSGVLASS